MSRIDPTRARLLSPEAAVDAMLTAARHQLANPIGRQRSPGLAGMIDHEGHEGFTRRFKAMPPLQALTELVHATANEGIDCDYQRPAPVEMELISSARGEALMTLVNEGQLSRMDQDDAMLLSCELEYALSDAQSHGCERDSLILQALTDRLDDPALDGDSFGRRHAGLIFTRHYQPSPSDPAEMLAFADELEMGWTQVAVSTDGVESLYVRSDELDAGRDAQAIRMVTAPGIAFLGMPMVNEHGRGTRVTMRDLAEQGITPAVQDVMATVPGQGEHLAATVASLAKEMDVKPTEEARHVLPTCLRRVISNPSHSPMQANDRRGYAPSAGI